MQTVNYDAILKNVGILRGKIGGAKLCAVVKCNAYGHGLERTARYLAASVDCFAVGSIAEANVISQFDRDILVLLPCDFNASVTAVKYGYILTVDGKEALKNAVKAAKICGVKARVHLKIDSGMHRLGFSESEISSLCEDLSQSEEYLSAEGIFSHFSSADTDGDFTLKQFQLFCRICDFVEKRLSIKPMRHIANTAAVFKSSEYALDMVRIGLGLYGYGGSELLPAKTVKARVLSVKQLKAGESVSYGNKFTALSDMKIAVVETGYAFGLPRSLSGKAVFTVNGKIAPILGTICMAMCIIDVTGIDLKPFDYACVLGGGAEPISKSDDVIIYELLCNLN